MVSADHGSFSNVTTTSSTLEITAPQAPSSNIIKRETRKQCRFSLKFNELQEKLQRPQVASQVNYKIRGCSLQLICTALTALLTCSLPAGYNIGVINTPQKVLRRFCNETNLFPDVTESQLDLIWSIIVSIFLVGAMIGCLLVSSLTENFGRKSTTIATAIVGLFGASCLYISKMFFSVTLLLMGRLFVGIHCGIASSLVPLFLMEVAPQRLRAPMGVMHNLGMTIGLLISQVLGQEQFLGSSNLWPYLVAFFSIFILFGLLTMLNTPESPAHLIMKLNEEDKALETIKSLYGTFDESEVLDTFMKLKQEKKNKEMQATSDLSINSSNSAVTKASFWSMIKSSKYRKPLLIVIMFHVGQQLCGINAVFYYSTKIFQDVGLTEYQSQMGSIATGALNVVMALISVHILNKFQIKTLMVTSSVAVTIFLISLTVTISLQDFYPAIAPGSVILVNAFVAGYGIGFGPIPFMVGSTLFDSEHRAIAMSIGCFFNWFCNFLVGITFPILLTFISQYIFLVFSLFSSLTTVFVLFYFKHEPQKGENGGSLDTVASSI